jgi:flagellar hook-basal body complex protein FliE
MISEDDVRDVLKQAAEDVSQLQSNPRAWLAWMVYFLARLEEKATNENPRNKESFVEMLSALQDAIRNRLRTGGWN